MKPHRFDVTYIDELGKHCRAQYTQRSAARGAMIILRAQGCTSVHLVPVWKGSTC